VGERDTATSLWVWQSRGVIKNTSGTGRIVGFETGRACESVVNLARDR
jgi:hypothetical protein